MCNLQGWLVDAIVDICGAETGSACGIEDVLAVLLGGSWFGARFSPASEALIC
jgi:hypothetical protein